MMTRRQLLKLLAASVPALSTSTALPAEDKPLLKNLGVCIFSYGIQWSAARSGQINTGFKDALGFLTHCHELGAAGVQVPLGSDLAETAKIRAKAESWNMYVEGQVSLPKADADIPRFEADLLAAKAAGADIVRAAMLSGRRYETFDNAEAFKEFAAQSWQTLVRSEPLFAKHKLRLALENHKDFRIPELLGMMKRISSPWVGICVDTGNSIALLEEPMSVVEAYAKFAFSCHLKDMAVQEYAEGFLLSEVPLGQGFLDIRRVIDLLHRANPKLRLNLEMITRDPLKIPCLTAKYRATVESATDQELTSMLALVRSKASKSLPSTAGLSAEERLKLEDSYVRQCFDRAGFLPRRR